MFGIRNRWNIFGVVPNAKNAYQEMLSRTVTNNASQQIPTAPIFSLPNELLAHIFVHLASIDVLNFASAHVHNWQLLNRVYNLTVPTVVVYNVAESCLYLSEHRASPSQRQQPGLVSVSVDGHGETRQSAAWRQFIDLLHMDLIENVEIDTTGCSPHVLLSFARMLSLCFRPAGKVFKSFTVKAMGADLSATFCSRHRHHLSTPPSAPPSTGYPSWRDIFHALSSVVSCESLSLFFDSACKCGKGCAVGDAVFDSWQGLSTVTGFSGSLGRSDFFSACPQLARYENSDVGKDASIVNRCAERLELFLSSALPSLSLALCLHIESLSILSEAPIARLLTALQPHPARMSLLGDWKEETWRLRFEVSREGASELLPFALTFERLDKDRHVYAVRIDCRDGEK